jgi:hypothetical protein
MKSAEAILLQIQSEQQSHDLLAHRDILNLDTQTRLKHMTLHFLKYAGKIASAKRDQDLAGLGNVLIDVFIICLATANALNVSVGAQCPASSANLDTLASDLAMTSEAGDHFDQALFDLVVIAGKMAKSIESTDHLERGNPRAELEGLIVELTNSVLISIGRLRVPLSTSVKARWQAIERKSIFSRLVEQ